jgi:hypothetical protein
VRTSPGTLRGLGGGRRLVEGVLREVGEVQAGKALLLGRRLRDLELRARPARHCRELDVVLLLSLLGRGQAHLHLGRRNGRRIRGRRGARGLRHLVVERGEAGEERVHVLARRVRLVAVGGGERGDPVEERLHLFRGKLVAPHRARLRVGGKAGLAHLDLDRPLATRAPHRDDRLFRGRHGGVHNLAEQIFGRHEVLVVDARRTVLRLSRTRRHLSRAAGKTLWPIKRIA